MIQKWAKNILTLQYTDHFQGYQKLAKCDSSPQDPDFLEPKSGQEVGGVAHLLKSQIIQKSTKMISHFAIHGPS